jgi:hypothetical protein
MSYDVHPGEVAPTWTYPDPEILEEDGVDDGKKFLTTEEMLWLDLNIERSNHFSTKLDLLKVQEEMRRVQVEKVYAEIQYLRSEHERLKRSDPTVASRTSIISQRLSELNIERQDKVLELRKQYEIEEEGFGWDPDTGEIVLGEE